MAFRDLNEFLTAEPLVLPICGKDYEFPGEISGRSWLMLQRLGAVADKARAEGEDFDPGVEVLNDLDQAELMSELFGDAFDELGDDDPGSMAMNIIFPTLMIYHLRTKRPLRSSGMQRETLRPRTGQQRGSQPSHGAPKVDRPAPRRRRQNLGRSPKALGAGGGRLPRALQPRLGAGDRPPLRPLAESAHPGAAIYRVAYPFDSIPA